MLRNVNLLFPSPSGPSSEENILAIPDKQVISGFSFLLSKARVGLWYLVPISLVCIPRHTHPQGFVSLTSSYVMSRCRALDLFPQGTVSKSLLIALGCELVYERERPTHVPCLKHELGHAIMAFFIISQAVAMTAGEGHRD